MFAVFKIFFEYLFRGSVDGFDGTATKNLGTGLRGGARQGHGARGISKITPRQAGTSPLHSVVHLPIVTPQHRALPTEREPLFSRGLER